MGGVIVRNRITKDLRRIFSELAYKSYAAAFARYPTNITNQAVIFYNQLTALRQLNCSFINVYSL
jgi:hypothetical protein